MPNCCGFRPDVKERPLSLSNAYDDARRAAAYATLGLSGTYFLAYRDLPSIIAENVTGRVALDFGCGTGRSTRFLKSLGFDALGIDISASMIGLAQRADPRGSYQLIDDGDFRHFTSLSFDLILSAFTFDSIPDADKRARLLGGLSELLRQDGRVVLLDSTPEIYTHEWVSFTTKGFPQNRFAKSGDAVRIAITDIDDQRPVVDSRWFHEDYLRLFARSGLEMIVHHKPLGRHDEPYGWHTELAVSPWVIYVLARGQQRADP